jgi:hypothetical protein
MLLVNGQELVDAGTKGLDVDALQHMLILA